MNITGVILAGGRGTRMGGVDKGLVMFGGKPLVQHVIERIRPQVETLLINANRNADAYARFGYPVIRDALIDGVQEFAGPLAGVYSALQHVGDDDLLLAVPCDAPHLPLDLVTRLRLALHTTGARAVYAHDGRRAQPACALFSGMLRDELRTALRNGTRKMESWLTAIDAAQADFSACPQAFLNINSAMDMPHD